MAITTVPIFRAQFIEFASGDRYPNPMIEYWISIAKKLMNEARWGRFDDPESLAQFGIMNFVAHNITLERRAMDAADFGGVPGEATGPVNNKSVDKVSLGYDTQAAIELDAGHWNLTIYGTRFIRLLRQVGMGGLQIGTGCAPSQASAAGAWAGPWSSNFPNQSG